MKRMIKASLDNVADYNGYDKYIDIVKGMVDRGDDEDDIRAYIRNLYNNGKIENYEKNLLNRDLRNYLIDREEANLTEDNLEDYYGLKPGTYSVSAFSGDYMEPVNLPHVYTGPGKAIQAWFRLGKKYPSNVMITGYRGKDEQALRDWAVNHEDLIAEWHEKYDCPYKLDWLMDVCKRLVRPSSIKGPDQLSPFDLG